MLIYSYLYRQTDLLPGKSGALSGVSSCNLEERVSVLLRLCSAVLRFDSVRLRGVFRATTFVFLFSYGRIPFGYDFRAATCGYVDNVQMAFRATTLAVFSRANVPWVMNERQTNGRYCAQWHQNAYGNT